jgi:hypothetical protein
MYKLVITGAALAVMGVAFAQAPNHDKAKDQATKLVDEPQLAVMLTKAGRRMPVVLVSLDSKELQYKLRQTDKTPRRVTATSGEIKAVQTGSGDIFAVNPKTTTFEKYDPATNTFTAAEQQASNEKPATGQEFGEGKDEKPKAQEKVVAEGLGATADEALKDAYRNAVRQVVGAVVDAETLLKNDEVISDKVLTYSDGFIKTYDEISKKKDRDLFRVKIAAQVERRSVVAKLKAANITVKAVDGGGLFATEVTTAEAQKNATALLKKGLQDLPGCLVATAASKPEFVRGRSEVVLDVAIAVDRKAYGAWLKKMEATLEKVCLRKGSVWIRGEDNRLENEAKFISFNCPFAGPALAKTESGAWCVWLNTFNDGTHTVTKWNWYVVDADAQESVKGLQGQLLVTVSLQGADGELVTEDQFRLEEVLNRWQPSRNLPPLWQAVLRLEDGTPDDSAPIADYSSHITLEGHFAEQGGREVKLTPNLFISPYSFDVARFGTAMTFRYQPQITLNRGIKVTLDELKKVEKVACKVAHTEEGPADRRGRR